MHMHWAGVIGMVFGFALFALALLCGTILIIARMRHGGSSKEKKFQTDEAKMIQEIFIGLERMEKRVEALETILMEGYRAERGQP